jgi:D-alanine-D-alanine ligase
MSRRIRVGILFGGQSAEHEISILSARNVGGHREGIDLDK